MISEGSRDTEDSGVMITGRGGQYGKNIISRFFLEKSRFTILSRFFVMLILLFCKLSEQYSQTKFPIIKPFKVTKKKKKEWQIFIIIIISYIYKATFWVLKALYIEEREYPQLPPMCSIHLDDATAAIVHQNAHHTSAYWWRGDSDEANQCMGMIRRPWWSEANLGQSGQRYKMLYISY